MAYWMESDQPVLVHHVFTYSTGGFTTCIAHLPESDMDIVVLRNLGPASQAACEQATFAIRAFLN
jgi:hypothetical protein